MALVYQVNGVYNFYLKVLEGSVTLFLVEVSCRDCQGFTGRLPLRPKISQVVQKMARETNNSSQTRDARFTRINSITTCHVRHGCPAGQCGMRLCRRSIISGDTSSCRTQSYGGEHLSLFHLPSSPCTSRSALRAQRTVFPDTRDVRRHTKTLFEKLDESIH